MPIPTIGHLALDGVYDTMFETFMAVLDSAGAKT